MCFRRNKFVSPLLHMTGENIQKIEFSNNSSRSLPKLESPHSKYKGQWLQDQQDLWNNTNQKKSCSRDHTMSHNDDLKRHYELHAQLDDTTVMILMMNTNHRGSACSPHAITNLHLNNSNRICPKTCLLNHLYFNTIYNRDVRNN